MRLLVIQMVNALVNHQNIMGQNVRVKYIHTNCHFALKIFKNKLSSNYQIHILACGCDVQGSDSNYCNSNGECSCESSSYSGIKCNSKIL